MRSGWLAPPKIKGNGKRALCRAFCRKKCTWVLVVVAIACAGLALVWHEELQPHLQRWGFAFAPAVVPSGAFLPDSLSSPAPEGPREKISPASWPSSSPSSSVSPPLAMRAAEAATAAAWESSSKKDGTSLVLDMKPDVERQTEQAMEEEEEEKEESAVDGPAPQEREDDAAAREWEAEAKDDDDSHDLFSEGLESGEEEEAVESEEEEEEEEESSEEESVESESESEEEEEDDDDGGDEIKEEEEEEEQLEEEEGEEAEMIKEEENFNVEAVAEAKETAAMEKKMMELEENDLRAATPARPSTGPPRAKAARNRRNRRTRKGGSNEEIPVNCEARYGTRHFLREEQQAEPPVLYSFPGSGNTWTRLLVDFATGIYSGTIISEQKAGGDKPLPGQGHCHRRVSAIKAHPHHYGPSELFAIPDNDEPYLSRCRRLGRIDGFKRFILLTRNPYDAIWSEYRRTTSPVILRHSFDRTGFVRTARLLADRYQEMVVAFREVRRTLPQEAVFNLKYEDLLNKDARLNIVLRLVDFIGINNDDETKKRRERATCALELAEQVGGGRRGTNVLKMMDRDEAVVTADEAYTPEIACAMWAAFGAAAKEMGYSLPGGITERDCRDIGAL